MVENSPSPDIPTLRRPADGKPLSGPAGQYKRTRFLDMDALAANLRTTVRLLEDGSNNWSKDGIPIKWKVRFRTKGNFLFNHIF